MNVIQITVNNIIEIDNDIIQIYRMNQFIILFDLKILNMYNKIEINCLILMYPIFKFIK